MIRKSTKFQNCLTSKKLENCCFFSTREEERKLAHYLSLVDHYTKPGMVHQNTDPEKYLMDILQNFGEYFEVVDGNIFIGEVFIPTLIKIGKYGDYSSLTNYKK